MRSSCRILTGKTPHLVIQSSSTTAINIFPMLNCPLDEFYKCRKKIKMAIIWRLNNAYVHFKKVLLFKLQIIKKGPICYVQMNKIKDYLHVKVGLKKPKTKLCSLDNSAYLTPLGTFSFKTFYFRDEIRMIHARTYTVTDRNVLLISNYRTML